MIHLDTHVVIWIENGDIQKLSPGARELIENEEVAVSPLVVFELGILYEMGRLTEPALRVVDDLKRSIGLRVDDAGLEAVARHAATPKFSFTREPLDRMIAAHADTAGVRLLTKDRKLRNHLDFAIWP